MSGFEFAPLQRSGQQLSEGESIGILCEQTRGVLSVIGDGGYPYGSPMNHYYNSEDGCLYFHCGKIGHRLRGLDRSDKVSYCVLDGGSRTEGDWAYTVRSVVVFGRAEVIDDVSKVAHICRLLSLRFTYDLDYIEGEISAAAHKTLLIRLTPEHICGKTVTEK